MAGGLLGLAIGFVGIRAILRLNPGNIPRVGLQGAEVVIDGWLMLFTLALTIFAGTALLLAVIGIYGLTSYSVQQRTQEIGIRLALGAESSAVRNTVVFQGMRLAIMSAVLA